MQEVPDTPFDSVKGGVRSKQSYKNRECCGGIVAWQYNTLLLSLIII